MRDKLASNNTNLSLPLAASSIPHLGIEPASADSLLDEHDLEQAGKIRSAALILSPHEHATHPAQARVFRIQNPGGHAWIFTI